MEIDELFKQLKNHIYCRIKPSQIGGVGVFAIKNIPANIDPFVGATKPAHQLMPLDKLGDLHPNVMKLVRDMFVFKDGFYHIPNNGLAQIDIAYYVNHSKSPNLRVCEDGHTFETIREIIEGEELCADYSTYNDEEDVFER